MLQHQFAEHSWLRWSAALGVLLGLAVATKLTAIFSLGAIAIWAGLLAVRAVLTRPNGVGSVQSNWLRRIWASIRTWVLALVIAVTIFVGVNPFLYPDPLARANQMSSHRLSEMRSYQRGYPQDALWGRRERLVFVVSGILLGPQVNSRDWIGRGLGHLLDNGKPPALTMLQAAGLALAVLAGVGAPDVAFLVRLVAFTLGARRGVCARYDARLSWGRHCGCRGGLDTLFGADHLPELVTGGPRSRHGVGPLYNGEEPSLGSKRTRMNGAILPLGGAGTVRQHGLRIRDDHSSRSRRRIGRYVHGSRTVPWSRIPSARY